MSVPVKVAAARMGQAPATDSRLPAPAGLVGLGSRRPPGALETAQQRGDATSPFGALDGNAISSSIGGAPPAYP